MRKEKAEHEANPSTTYSNGLVSIFILSLYTHARIRFQGANHWQHAAYALCTGVFSNRALLNGVLNASSSSLGLRYAYILPNHMETCCADDFGGGQWELTLQLCQPICNVGPCQLLDTGM